MITSRKLYICGFVFVLILAVSGGAVFAEDDAKKAKDESWKNEIIEKMGKKAEFDYEDAELQAVISQLSKLANVNIILHPGARLMEDGSPRLVTLYANNMSCMAALEAIVFSQRDIGFELRDEAILIDLKYNFELRYITKTYDISDLIFERENRNPPVISEPGSDVLLQPVPCEEIILRIQEIIRAQEPDSWADPRVSILVHHDKLLISQTAVVHKMIEKVLKYLRSAEKTRLTLEGSILEIPQAIWTKVTGAQGHIPGQLSSDEISKINELTDAGELRIIRTFNIEGHNRQRIFISEKAETYASDSINVPNNIAPGFIFEILPVLSGDRNVIYAEIGYSDCSLKNKGSKKFKSGEILPAQIFETSLAVPVRSSFYFTIQSQQTSQQNVKVFLAKVSTINPNIVYMPLDPNELASKTTLEWQKDIERKLQKKIDVNFEDARLFEVMKLLSKSSGINIIIYPGALTLEDGGKRIVSLKVPNMTIRNILDWIILFQRDLSWEYRNEAIYIDLKSNIEGKYVKYVYDVNDLVFYKKDFKYLLGANFLSQFDTAAWGFPSRRPEMPEDELVLRIEEILRAQDPDSYCDPQSFILSFRGILIVNQRRDVHELIKKCLENLRKDINTPITYTGTVYEIDAVVLEKLLGQGKKINNGFELSDEQLNALSANTKANIKRSWTFTQLSGQRSYFADVEYKGIPFTKVFYDYGEEEIGADDDQADKEKKSKEDPAEIKARAERTVVFCPAGFVFDARGVYLPGDKSEKGSIRLDLILKESEYLTSSGDEEKAVEKTANYFMTIPEGGTVGLKIGMSGNGKGKNGRKVLFLVLRADVNGK